MNIDLRENRKQWEQTGEKLKNKLLWVKKKRKMDFQLQKCEGCRNGQMNLKNEVHVINKRFKLTELFK